MNQLGIISTRFLRRIF